MKKIFIVIFISFFFFNLVHSKENIKLKEKIVMICTGDLTGKNRITSLEPKKFVDEYSVTLNTLKNNEETNKIPKNNFIDYYKDNPVRTVELINSNYPTERIVLVSQDLLKREGGNVNGKLRPKNMNPEFYKLLYPTGIGKVYYSELWFENNIINLRYKFIHNLSPPQIQSNNISISLNTGSYRSNVMAQITEGRFKNEKFHYNFNGFCNVDNIVSYLNNLKTDSKGSFSYNYLFFLLIIIGITIFVYKQGPKKKRKTK